MHWLAAGSIVTLVVTGFYIGQPYFMTGGEASTHFLMGRVRFIHFTAAGVLVATGIVRVYWLFAGNRFERWKALFPVRRKDWVHLVQQVKYYLLIHPERAPHYLGHNPLQQISYTALYGIAFVQAVTGFALYGLSNPGGFANSLFGWVDPLLGGAQVVRFWHHVISWVFVIFFPIHVYLAIRADVTEREASISSMVSGGRFRRAGLYYEDEDGGA